MVSPRRGGLIHAVQIIVDLPQASRVAVLRDDRLIAYFADQGHDAAPAPGAVVVARVDRVFPGRRLIACDLGGIAASLRWQKGAMPKTRATAHRHGCR